eukprot:1549846-Alexandrium_andersonii.AAC.1
MEWRRRSPPCRHKVPAWCIWPWVTHITACCALISRCIASALTARELQARTSPVVTRSETGMTVPSR